MLRIELRRNCRVRKQFGQTTALEPRRLQRRRRRVRVAARRQRLREVDAAAHHRRLRAADYGTVRIYRRRRHRPSAGKRPTNLVFQRGALFPHMSVRKNIGYSLKLQRWEAARIKARVDEMLALVRLDGLGEREPSQLSGGQAQRVALARALAGESARAPARRTVVGARPEAQAADAAPNSRAIQKRLGATFVFVTPRPDRRRW